MIKILLFDIKQILRENFLGLSLLVLIYVINFPLYSKTDNLISPLLFVLINIYWMLIILDLLAKGITFKDFVNFPNNIREYLKYLTFKYFVLVAYGIVVSFFLLTFLFGLKLFSQLVFLFMSIYLLLTLYFLLSIFWLKNFNLNILIYCILGIVLVMAYLLYTLLFYFIGFWVIAILGALIFFFHKLLIEIFSVQAENYSYELLEN